MTKPNTPEIPASLRALVEKLPRAVVKGGMLSVQSTWVEQDVDQLVRLDDVLAALRAAYAQGRADAEAQLAALRPYCQHKDDCPWEMRNGTQLEAVAPC